jgi:methionyl-tRNA formyltransferase
MRVVFMGTPEFAVESLNKLLSAGINIVGVVTVPDKPQGRGLKLQPSPVKIAAQNAGLPILQPTSLVEAQCIAPLCEMKPDIIVVVAFKILPEQIFTIPPLGTINLHGSLLPRYRGAAPINWAIINGEIETGVTTFFIQKKVDTGNIIMQEKIAIGPDMTAGELHDIMAGQGADLLVKTVQAVETDNYKLSTQDEAQVSKAPKIRREDCEINFNQPAQQLHNFIRGLSPYPAAFTYLNGKMIRLFKSRMLDTGQIMDDLVPASRLDGDILAGKPWAFGLLPGKIIKITNYELQIACRDSAIAISEVQLEGKKRMTVAEFLRGYKLKVGDRFGNNR